MWYDSDLLGQMGYWVDTLLVWCTIAVVSDELLVKNLNAMGKAIKDLGLDLKNAKNQQNRDEEDRFVEVA